MNFLHTEKRPSSESMSKFIHDRLSHVEKNFGDLCTTFSSYARKTAKLRDKGDELSQLISSYVGNEVLNPSSKEQLTLFAENLSTIQDYRQAQVQRLDANVIKQFASYGLKCKNKKAKSDLAKASADASLSSKTIEKEMDVFEQQKLTDMKKQLMNFVNAEMTFHCKALELYTQCYQNLSEINVEKDLEGFRKHVHPPKSLSRMEMARKASAGTISPIKPAFSPSNTQQQPNVMTFTEDDDDEDEDDDDEYEDDDDEEEEASNGSLRITSLSATKQSYQKK